MAKEKSVISRRNFLMSSSAAIVAAALPMPIPALPVPEAAAAAIEPAKLAFIIGTPDCFDWQVVMARTYEEAFAEYCQGWGLDAGEIAEIDPDEHVSRVPSWDGRDPKTITPHEWFKEGFGHVCSRCSDECFAENGGRIIGDEVVCEYCLTFADRVICDPSDVAEELGCDIAADGVEAVRALMEKMDRWKHITPAVWDEACRVALEVAGATG